MIEQTLENLDSVIDFEPVFMLMNEELSKLN